MAKPVKLTIHDFIFKPFLYLALAQVVILLFFSIFYSGDTIRYIDCENATIRVEDKYVVDVGSAKSRKIDFYVTYGGEEYLISESLYSPYELEKMISIGERLEVFYTREYSLSRGDYYYAIDVRGDDEIYADIDEHNAQREKTATIVFIVFEAIYAFAVFLVVYLNEYDFKDFIKRLKSKIKKVKRQKEKEAKANAK